MLLDMKVFVALVVRLAPAINSMSMMFPMIMYRITHKDK